MNKPYKVKITFLRKCPFYEEGEEVILNNDEFFRMMNEIGRASCRERV